MTTAAIVRQGARGGFFPKETGPDALWVPVLAFWIANAATYFACGCVCKPGIVPTPIVGCYIATSCTLGRSGQMPLLASIATPLRSTCPDCEHGMMGTYVAATLNRPLADHMLIAADKAIGYDWERYATLFATPGGIPALILPSSSLIAVLPTFALTALVLLGERRRADTIILAMARAIRRA